MEPRPRQVLVLANPRAGSGQSRRVVETLLLELHLADLEPTVCWEREELSRLVGQVGRDLHCVVAAGGDGTVLEVVNRAPGVPIAVLPLGTENLLARHWGVERCGRHVASVVKTARICRLDLARAGDRLFCLMASVGFDAAVVHEVQRRRRGHITRLSYALPILQELRNYPFPVVEVENLETGERLRGSLAFLFNLPRYGLGLPIAPEASAHDGLLDLVLFERPGVAALAGYVRDVVLRRHLRRGDVHHRQGKRFRLHATEPVPLQVDGDPGPVLPLDVEVLPGALTLYVP